MIRTEQLADWVALQHEGQLIKRTNEPYFSHLAAVASMARPATGLGFEIAICHDLLEDTTVTEQELTEALSKFGYTDKEAHFITSCVVELTEVFTAKAYPDLSKLERKELEAARLITISPEAQTVKYSDLINNINWVLQHDQKHSGQYLLKKQQLLAGLTLGDQALRRKALSVIRQGLIIT